MILMVATLAHSIHTKPPQDQPSVPSVQIRSHARDMLVPFRPMTVSSILVGFVIAAIKVNHVPKRLCVITRLVSPPELLVSDRDTGAHLQTHFKFYNVHARWYVRPA